MALSKELLKLLNNEEEPMKKRLKIADNAFKSVELPIQNREAVLISWIGNMTKNKDSADDVWNLLWKWLNSQQIEDLNRNDFGQDDLRRLMTVLVKTSDKTNLKTVLDCANVLVGNRKFQMYFKHDFNGYCEFVAEILLKFEDEQALCGFLKNEHLFDKSFVSNKAHLQVFIDKILPSFGFIVNKFKSKKIIDEASKIIENCFFRRNFQPFSRFFNLYYEKEADGKVKEKLPYLPKILLKQMRNFYDHEVACEVYKIIFTAFSRAFNNNFEMIYRFFGIIIQMLGYDVREFFNADNIKEYSNETSSITKSIKILTGLCEVLTETRNELNTQINNHSFSEFLQNLTTNIIHVTKHPNKENYVYLKFIIAIDPLILEKLINDILIYVTTSDGEKNDDYEGFLILVFEVFTKLHRIPHLISKMVPAIKSATDGNFVMTKNVLNFLGVCEEISETLFNQHLLPEAVLHRFTQSVILLPSWQVINLFKTLLFHLEGAVSNDLTKADEDKVVYIELICTLMYRFLYSVRIVEHTVTVLVVEKFLKAMMELKDVLSRFGLALVSREHNPQLMRSYLKICYAWGDLYGMLGYYSSNDEVPLPKTTDSDSSACNITYLHPYLTRDQWCLISQRIANFGEKPCKLIMYKLYIQKLRSMLLFEETVNEEVIAAIRSSILSSIDDNWKELISDKLVLDEIITKSNRLPHIADLVLRDAVETNNFKELHLLFDYQELIAVIIYKCLYRINKSFKRKHKRGESLRVTLFSKLFSNMKEDVFVQSHDDFKQLEEVFVKEFAFETKRSNENNLVVNENDIRSYLNVIQKIPIVQSDNLRIQQVLTMHLMCLLLDLQASMLQDSGLLEQCEKIIIGLAHNYSGSFVFLITPFSTTKTMIDKFPRGFEFFRLIMQNILKTKEHHQELVKNVADHLRKNIKKEKYTDCLAIMLNDINKYKKTKLALENKSLLVECQEDICKSFCGLITECKEPEVEKLTEAFALTLNLSLAQKYENVSNALLPFIEPYIEGLMTLETTKQAKGAILLFTTVLRHKSQLKTVEDKIVLQAWRYCQKIEIDDENIYEDCSKLIVLIFELIPNKEFPNIAKDLLNVSEEILKLDDGCSLLSFIKHLKIWNAILSCSFNPIKTKTMQNILESLLERILTKISKMGSYEAVYEDIVKFQINLIRDVHLLLTGHLIESILLTVSIISSNSTDNFVKSFSLSISLLEMLMKFRQPLLMDYLPGYLQRYRTLLKKLCIQSNSDLKLDAHQIQQISDCAHKLEKLTNVLNTCQRHVMRISPYLIADILKQYEEITLYPNVKMHLNNCLYSWISLCDHHAIAYLMRILSTASTEMFKIIYENYKKYYKFTGRV